MVITRSNSRPNCVRLLEPAFDDFSSKIYFIKSSVNVAQIRGALYCTYLSNEWFPDNEFFQKGHMKAFALF